MVFYYYSGLFWYSYEIVIYERNDNWNDNNNIVNFLKHILKRSKRKKEKKKYLGFEAKLKIDTVIKWYKTTYDIIKHIALLSK